MPEQNNPPRLEVKPQVVKIIFDVMTHFGFPDRPYTLEELQADEKINLLTQLRISDRVRRQMAIPYTNLSVKQYHGKKVAQNEAAEAVTIKKAIDLVHGKANDK
jgi:hypothetical protein